MNTINELIKEFNHIYKMGYVKSVNNNKNSVGLTIERELKSTGGDFNVPDYYDIEIKALRNYYKAEFDLFNSAPDGKYPNASKWISSKFGYPDRDFKNVKVLKGNIYANKRVKIGLFYQFKLEIDRSEEKIYLLIYNYYGQLINKDIYWDFSSLKEKLERKLTKLAIFGFRKKYINEELHIFYNQLRIYTLKEFSNFLEALEKGYIFLTFKTGVFKKGPYTGKFTDHGTSFRISKDKLNYLFNEHHLVWDKKKELFVLN